MWLTIEVPGEEPRTIEVKGDRATIGSDAECEILIADDEVSPQHSGLRTLPDGRLEIEDLDSRTGTWVGGVRISGEATLEGGEQIRVGRTDVTVSRDKPDPDEAPLTRRATIQRLVRESRRATVLATAAVAIAAVAVILAAAGVFSGSEGSIDGGSLSTTEVVDLARPATSLVVAYGAGSRVGNGTGWVYDADEGLVVTNAHVIDAGETFEVGSGDELTSAEVVGVAPCDDLAVLQAEDTEGLEELELGSQSSLAQGDSVVAVGYPVNASPADELQVTTGIVSVVEQAFDVPADPFVQLYENVIQIDAPINPGNSGGPLVDTDGRLVGVNTLIFRGRRGEIEGQGYAIGVDRVKEVVPGLSEGDSQGWEGYAFRALPEELARRQGLPPGLLVTAVVPGTPAEEAGIEAQRAIVVGVDGNPVSTFREYCNVIDDKNGETVEFNIVDQSGARTVDLEI